MTPPTSTNERRAASQARAAGFGFTLPAVAWVALFFAAPLIIMAVYSFLPLTSDGSPPHLSFKAYGDFFAQPAYVQAIWNSEPKDQLFFRLYQIRQLIHNSAVMAATESCTWVIRANGPARNNR